MYKLLLIALLAAPSTAMAVVQSQGEAFSPEKGLDVASSFEAQRNAILAALQDGKTYVEISQENREQVRQSLDRIAGLIGERASVEELGEAAKVEVFNEQEKVNVLLTQAHNDSRLVCRREKRVGSHHPVNTCATVAQRRRDRDESQDVLRQIQRAPLPARN